MADGACVGYPNPEAFFPTDEQKGSNRYWREARAVCNRCQVRMECLVWAMEEHIVHGMWGGTTNMEREAIRKGVPLALAPVESAVG